MAQMKLAGLCGSLRAASFNRKLMLAAAESFGPVAFTEGNLRLPLFDEDLEAAQGSPAEVLVLADAIRQADAVVIACPEYNKGPTGVLKNALDWLSRVKGGVWRDKPVAIVSAAAGRAGGERAQFALRLMMISSRARVLPGPEVLVGNAAEHFDPEGRLVTESYRKFLDDLMAELRAEASLGRRRAAERAEAAA